MKSILKNSEKLKKKLRRYGYMTAILFYPLFLWVIFFFGINFKSILYSFQKIDIYGNVDYVGFDNYVNFLKSFFVGSDASLIIFSFYNSIKWWFCNLLISTPINLAFAYYVFCNFKGSKAFRICAMIPVMISGMIFSLMFEKTLNFSLMPLLREHFGMQTANLFTDEKWAFPINLFYSLWSGLTTCLIILPNAMKSGGMEIIEASMIDGCGIYARFWYIILPVMMPVLVSTWVMGIAGMWGTSYNLVTFYKYSAPESVYTLGYYFTVRVMTGSTEVEYPAMAAAGFCLTIFATTVTMIAKHFLMKLQAKFE